MNTTEKSDSKPTIQLMIRRAHTQMRGTYQYVGQKTGAVNFLRKKKNPYDYDVELWTWDGKEWNNTPIESGDEFLKAPKKFLELSHLYESIKRKKYRAQ